MARQLFNSVRYGFAAVMLLLFLVAIGGIFGLLESQFLNIIVISAAGLTMGGVITLMIDCRRLQAQMNFLVEQLAGAPDEEAEPDQSVRVEGEELR